MQTSKQEVDHHGPQHAKISTIDIPNEAAAAVEEEVTFFHDFIAGGIAGSASIVVGHPFDTIKVCDIRLLVQYTKWLW